MSFFKEERWIEGPLPRFLQPQLLELTYLLSSGPQRYKLVLAPAAGVVRVKGQLQDKEQQYPLLRSPTAPAAEQEGLEKILLLGDQHGHCQKLFRFLSSQQVVDASGNWQWGAGHLVMCGDLLDRGLQVLPLLWWLCRLEQQATAAGGAVHVLLGNHELMVMQEDYRYVHPQLLQLYRRAGLAYAAPFSKDWYLGQWLRSRNTVIKLNGLLISHAGISPAIAGLKLTIAQINQLVQRGIDEPTAEAEALLANGGPLWYRGYVGSTYMHHSATAAEARQVLEQYDASHMVVAHTPVRHIEQRLQGQVWAIDLNIESPRVAVEGLLLEDGAFRVLETVENG